MVFCTQNKKRKKKKKENQIIACCAWRNYSDITKATFGSTLLSYRLSIWGKRLAFTFGNCFFSNSNTYYIHMKIQTIPQHVSRWNMCLLSSSNGLFIYVMLFLIMNYWISKSERFRSWWKKGSKTSFLYFQIFKEKKD